MFKRMAILAMALLIPATAIAGNVDDDKYISNLGYTIKPPADWVRMDASNASGLTGHLPQNISPQIADRFDVIFFPNTSKCEPTLYGDTKRMDANAQKLRSNKKVSPDEIEKPANEYTETLAEFAPSISILALKDTISDENLEKDLMGDALKEALLDKKSKSSSIKGFSPIVEKSDDGSSFVSHASFTSNGRKIKSEQHIIPKGKKTFIITCTYDADNDADKTAMEKDGLCKKVVKSFKYSGK